MYISLVNLEGKTLDSFRDEAAARAALRATVEANPALADEVMLLHTEDSGEPVGNAIMFEDLGVAKVGALTGVGLAMAAGVASAAVGYQVVRRREDEPAVGQWEQPVPTH